MPIKQREEQREKTPLYRDVRHDWEFAHQRRFLITQSPDGMYQLMLVKRYKNLVLHNLWNDTMVILQRNMPYHMDHEVRFIDERTFFIHCGETVDFYDAATARKIPYLEISFGHRHGDKHLLGFCHSREDGRFAALYVEEEPPKTYGHKYHAVLFDGRGAVLDDFRTDVELVQGWGGVVKPRLDLKGDRLTVHARQFTADYLITFFVHQTQVTEKALA